MLNEQSTPDLDAIFAALAHPTRRAIIEELARGDRTVSELAAPHKVSLPAISQHLRVLEEAGLVAQTKEGRLRICNLEAAPLSSAFSWILRYRVFWEDVLDDVQRRAEADAESTAGQDQDAPAGRPRQPARPNPPEVTA